MKHTALSFAVLLLACTTALAGEWTGSIKAGLFQDKSRVLDQVQVAMIDAIQTAEKELPGMVVKAELEKEDGYLVYSVEVQENEGKKREVLIDPVNGKVLEKDAGD